jgi:transposase-like protein
MTAPDRGTIKPENSCIEGAVHTWLDATYVKVREAGRIVPVAVTIAVGVNADGRRDRAPIAASRNGDPRCLAWRSAVRRRNPSGSTSCAR